MTRGSADPLPTGTLYIVDGSSTGGSLRLALGKRPSVVVWRDSLEWGPVPSRLSLSELSRVRARFWGVPASEFEKRDAALGGFSRYEKIVLCFGPGVHEQLGLAQVLDWLGEQGMSGVDLSLVSVSGASLMPDRFRVALDAGRPVTAAQMRLARRFWAAFQAPTPKPLQQMLGRDLRALPELRNTIRFLLQEYPEVHDGLSRLQRKLLTCAASLGATQPAWIVGVSLGGETCGDVKLYEMLWDFIHASHQLLASTAPCTARVPGTVEFRASQIAATPLSFQVLAGKADHIEWNGIDRWIGGVHLRGGRCRWRWDERQQRIAAV